MFYFLCGNLNKHGTLVYFVLILKIQMYSRYEHYTIKNNLCFDIIHKSNASKIILSRFNLFNLTIFFPKNDSFNSFDLIYRIIIKIHEKSTRLAKKNETIAIDFQVNRTRTPKTWMSVNRFLLMTQTPRAQLRGGRCLKEVSVKNMRSFNLVAEKLVTPKYKRIP